MISFSTFRNKFDKHPSAKQLPYDAFTAMLTNHVTREDKDGPLWSPATFSGTRTKSNVIHVSALVLDLDSGETYTDFRCLWDLFEHIVYTSYSHRIGDDGKHKWRAIFPLVSPVTNDQWGEVWRKLTHHLAPSTDPSCSDSSRMYYLPSCPTRGIKFARGFSHGGNFLDHTEFEDLPKPEVKPRNLNHRPSGNGRPGDDFEERMSWDDLCSSHAERLDYSPYRGRTAWRRNGKDDGVSFFTGPCDYGDRLINFSSDPTLGLPTHKPLKKFDVYAIWDHGGDFVAAAKELRKLGYGGNK